MRRALAFAAAVVFIAGCGEGPKHLPKSDYQHGKAAFELLEQYEQTSSFQFQIAAEKQFEPLVSGHLDNGLLRSLMDYEESITERLLANSQLTKARADAIMAKHGVSMESLAEKQGELLHSLDQLEPIIKLCRDDAAQYFDASAASTNTCDSELKVYRAKHDHKKEN